MYGDTLFVILILLQSAPKYSIARSFDIIVKSTPSSIVRDKTDPDIEYDVNIGVFSSFKVRSQTDY